MYAMAMSAYPFAKALSSPYIGHLSDRWGRRKVLVWTLIATAVCLHLCGVAQSYAAVLACRLLTGCVANGGLLTARATDIVTDLPAPLV
jgi:MFS family permease